MALQTRLSIVSLIVIIITSCVANSRQDRVWRSEYEQDEGSCICGLNKGILDQLESIVLTSTSSCSSGKLQEPVDEQSVVPVLPQARDPDAPTSPNIPMQENEASHQNQLGVGKDETQVINPVITNNDVTITTNQSSQQQTQFSESNDPLKPTEQTANQAATTGYSSFSFDLVSKLTSEIQKLQEQLNSMQNQHQQAQQQIVLPQISRPSGLIQSSEPTTTSTSSSYSYSLTHSANGSTAAPFQIKQDYQPSSTGALGVPNGSHTIIITGFLNGLPSFVANSQNDAPVKLNQSQVVESQEVTSALQSTVPNVVSNIFSSIQNLTLFTEQNKATSNESNTGVLTSIDGSTVEIHRGDSKDDITANGEKLFLLWIEHQLNNLHLTASMANYIRKSALSMFRRIVNQYVERMTRVGGSLEYNVQRATQIALNNTQNLISFLLKNYINFAGGIMQIIGEQVSRVGKQLDSTGDKITQTNLNPFDMVSNVIDSLPNPSNYSKYFREFGKHLVGDISTATTPAPSSEIDQSPEKQQSNSTLRPQSGIITKTMGALGKTLNKLLG